MALTIIQDLWESYRQQVVPHDAPLVQVQETKRAFFAGVNGLFGAIIGILDEGSEATERDLLVMAAIHRELEAFNAAVQAGRN